MNKVINSKIAFIGSVGIPNRYGGFESFLENICPFMNEQVHSITVTCSRDAYINEEGPYLGVNRTFISCPANGIWSIIHDLIAFFSIMRKSTHIFILGVSGGVWFPLFRLICSLQGKCLILNVDGLEWKRGKFSKVKRLLLWILDYLAQLCSHVIIIDNASLKSRFPAKTFEIAYSGDHVLHLGNIRREKTALTICRIEPENNIEMLIKGFINSNQNEYIIIGNWDNSKYGIELKRKYSLDARLRLLDPVYDQTILSKYREECSYYIHGHSVGGTNPSLIEMLYYDSNIFCFDVPYHHSSVGDQAHFFKTDKDLSNLLDSSIRSTKNRNDIRERYSKNEITNKYIELITSTIKE